MDDIRSGRVSWNAAWDHISAVLRDPSSHTIAAVHGHKYVPTQAAITAWDIWELEVNSRRSRGQLFKKFPRPWVGKPPSYDLPVKVDSSAREVRRKKLSELF